MVKVIGTGQLKTVRGMAILAFRAIMWLYPRLVAVGTLVGDVLNPVVTGMAGDLGVLALQAYRVCIRRIQFHQRPGLAMTSRVGTETRIVAAKVQVTVTLCTGIVGQEPVVADEIALQVRRWFLAGDEGYVRR
jgi:hypothetical protein